MRRVKKWVTPNNSILILPLLQKGKSEQQIPRRKLLGMTALGRDLFIPLTFSNQGAIQKNQKFQINRLMHL